MSAFFTASSNQYLSNAAPIVVAPPFTVGMWVNLTAVGNAARTLFALSDTGTTNNYTLLRMTSAELLSITARAGGTEAGANVASGSIPAGRWSFVLGRFITTTARRCSFYIAHGTGAGAVSHGSISSLRAATGIDTLTIGGLLTSGGLTEPWDGGIAEYWLTNDDVQPENAATYDWLVRQLAWGGPFSVPYLARSVVEYRSFRKYPSSDADDLSEVYYTARPTLVNNAGVTTYAHPPLPYWYRNPRDFRGMMVA